MNHKALRFLDNFLSLYEVSVSHHLTSQSPILILGKGSFICRFCGKGKPNVRFWRKAHALPEFIGNKVLFSHWECDSCNSKFGRLLESQFAAFMHLNHTVFAVEGKDGFPKYKSENVTIEQSGAHLNWKGVPDENINHEIQNEIVHITQKMPSFIPIAVYKTLVKMAITIMPAAELENFEDTVRWITEETHGTIFNLKNLWMYYGSSESSDRWDQISAVLSKKRADNNDPSLPYMLFSLSYGNFNFQLPLPLCTKDKGEISEPSAITYLPHLADFKNGLGSLKVVAFNMHYTDFIVNKQMTFTLTNLDGSGTITSESKN